MKITDKYFFKRYKDSILVLYGDKPTRKEIKYAKRNFINPFVSTKPLLPQCDKGQQK